MVVGAVCKDGKAIKAKGGAPPATAKEERKLWFGKDEKISEMIGANRQWTTTTKGELLKCKEELMKTIAETECTPDVAEAIKTELRLMHNRVRAIKLVLSEAIEGDAADDAQAAGTPSTVLPPKS